MVVVAAETAENELGRQVATLTLAHVRPAAVEDTVRAATWYNLLLRLGVRLPLCMVQDLGLLLTGRRGQSTNRQVAPPAPGSPLGTYAALLAAVADGAAGDMAGAPLRDELVAALLARLVGDVAWRVQGARGPNAPATELPLVSSVYGMPAAQLAGRFDPTWCVPLLRAIGENSAVVLARLEQLDGGGLLRLLGTFAVDENSWPDLAGLYELVSTAGVADTAEFSLQLLPSLLETKRRPAAQRFAIDGYTSLERRGSADALLPSELAHDDEVFELKALQDELYYYGHERQRDRARKLHYLLVDASASMRGVRQVFARGLALALTKKWCLLGGEVWLRFFDSRLHERIRLGGGGGGGGSRLNGSGGSFALTDSASRALPYLLGFRSERGRNYGRVFEQLAAELTRVRRDDGRDVALTFITHAECHIPQVTVANLTSVASLHAVFVLPSRPLALDYLDLLSGYDVVTAETLYAAPEKRRRRALEIVEQLAVRREEGSRGAT